ncbi:hypothetical protein [Flavobacterium pectinovorum]|uniref:hypothetical protein n=1 Tax=Flavobacterium pectinovorum TaxID=29533 RepID=UPI001FADDEB7|nr:hypothetical protein [Flavobacterium pectinovorum]MCI9843510.1 hypothetical protein [Flavobacterium pectinovorum]
MNYGETNAYWFLRLNGFFLIENFVVHRTEDIEHSSDIDLLGIRLPYVFEEIGGQNNDWDEALMGELNPNLMTGIICEVKTGAFNNDDLFRKKYLHYYLDRFGFMPNLSDHVNQIYENKVTVIEHNGTKFQILKLFISNQESQRKDFLQLQIKHLRSFIENRIQKYKVQKWQDRLFFQCDFLGEHIDRKYHEEN